MKKAKDLINIQKLEKGFSVQEMKSETSSEKLSSMMIDKIFKAFCIHYDDRFFSKIATSDMEAMKRSDWAFTLRSLSDIQVSHGIKRSFSDFSYPPNATEFLALAKTCPELTNNFLQLDREKQRKDFEAAKIIAQGWIEKIKKSLK